MSARCEAAGVFERPEGAVDLACFLVAAEEVADFGAADPIGSVFGEGPDVVGGGVAEAVAEDPGAAGVGIGPDCARGGEVVFGDLVAGVKQCVDEREPGGVRLGAGGRDAIPGRSAESSG